MFEFEDVVFKDISVLENGEGTNLPVTGEENTNTQLGGTNTGAGIGASENGNAEIKWSPENLGESASHMGIGMLGVFLIVGIIMASTYIINAVINKITSKKKEDSEE